MLPFNISANKRLKICIKPNDSGGIEDIVFNCEWISRENNNPKGSSFSLYAKTYNSKAIKSYGIESSKIETYSDDEYFYIILDFNDDTSNRNDSAIIDLTYRFYSDHYIKNKIEFSVVD